MNEKDIVSDSVEDILKRGIKDGIYGGNKPILEDVSLFDFMKDIKNLSGFIKYMRSLDDSEQLNVNKVMHEITANHLHSNYKVGYDVIFKEILAGPIYTYDVDKYTFSIYPNGVSQGPIKLEGLVHQKYVMVYSIIRDKAGHNSYANYFEILQSKELSYEGYVKSSEEEKSDNDRIEYMMKELKKFAKEIELEPWFQ